MSENADKNLRILRAKVSIEFYIPCPICSKVKVIDHYDNINEIQDYKEVVSCCGKRFIASIEKH